MSDQYVILDRLILAAIEAGRSPIYDPDAARESERVASSMGREGFRVLDGRLTALKKAGRIEFRTKLQAAARGVRGGWGIRHG